MCSKTFHPFSRKYKNVLLYTKCNLLYGVPHETSVIRCNGLKNDFQFLAKNLAKHIYSSDFNCLGENRKKYISFLFLWTKRLK